MIHFKNKKLQEIKNRQIQQENQDKIKALQEKMVFKSILKKPEKPVKCTYCKMGKMRTILVFDQRWPPIYHMGDSQNFHILSTHLIIY